MPNVSGLVDAISADVVYKLNAAGYAPLTDGKILIGRQHIFEMSSPPRVVFIPISSSFSTRAMYNRAGPDTLRGPGSEWVLQTQERSVLTDRIMFEVHVWGIATPPDPNAGDFDYTQALYQQVIASTHLIAVGSYEISNGKWADQQQTSSQMLKTGTEFVFMLTLDTPILDRLLPLVPEDTAPNTTVILQPSDGDDPNPEDALTGV